MTSPASLVDVRDLRTAFGARLIHDGLDLSIGRGEVVAVAGDNGSGKTTLLRTLLGLRAVDAGKVELLGQSPPFSREHLSHVGALIGHAAVLPWMRPVPFLRMLLETAGESDAGRAAAALAFVGLPEDRLRTKLGKLSQGEQQLVGLAVALVRSPELVLLDEPFAHLDVEHVVRVQSAVQSIAEGGGSVLFTTHRVSEAEMADRLLILSGGKLVEASVGSSLARSVLR